jgi:hypothetical protein
MPRRFAVNFSRTCILSLLGLPSVGNIRNTDAGLVEPLPEAGE